MHVVYLLKINKDDLEKTEDTRYTYRNKLEKSCLQHDMVYRDFKDLAKRTASDNVLRDITNINKNPKDDGYQ